MEQHMSYIKKPTNTASGANLTPVSSILPELSYYYLAEREGHSMPVALNGGHQKPVVLQKTQMPASPP